MTKKRIQPSSMVNSPAFSQAIEVSSGSTLLFIGGQNAVDENGKVVGQGDFLEQSKQALINLKTVLENAGYSIENVLKWTIYFVQGNNPRLGFKAFQEIFGIPEVPPTITVIQVAGLASPDCLIEVDAIAAK
jgi:enamine deaminase RidA (YjgF/YER057c/UK114 family)